MSTRGGRRIWLVLAALLAATGLALLGGREIALHLAMDMARRDLGARYSLAARWFPETLRARVLRGLDDLEPGESMARRGMVSLLVGLRYGQVAEAINSAYWRDVYLAPVEPDYEVVGALTAAYANEEDSESRDDIARRGGELDFRTHVVVLERLLQLAEGSNLHVVAMGCDAPVKRAYSTPEDDLAHQEAFATRPESWLGISDERRARRQGEMQTVVEEGLLPQLRQVAADGGDAGACAERLLAFAARRAR